MHAIWYRIATFRSICVTLGGREAPEGHSRAGHPGKRSGAERLQHVLETVERLRHRALLD